MEGSPKNRAVKASGDGGIPHSNQLLEQRLKTLGIVLGGAPETFAMDNARRAAEASVDVPLYISKLSSSSE